MPEVRVGDTVIFHDTGGHPHNALITAVWGITCINLLYVSEDDSQQDQYGRQIIRQSSVSHKSVNPVHGNYWRLLDEEPNPYSPPVEK